VKIYLAGPINGLSDEEAMGWRAEAKKLLQSYVIKDPMVRDYRVNEYGHEQDIVINDLKDIAECDIILVNASHPSWGTAMEMAYARMMFKTIVAFVPEGPVSPWITHHATAVARSLSAAAHYITLWEEMEHGS
jgi:nucleoside 2-deoxyribosyltransferase